MTSIDSFDCRKTLRVNDSEYIYYSIQAAEDNGAGDLSKLPYSLKVLAENMLRNEDGVSVTADDIMALGKWASETQKKSERQGSKREINFYPARILMPDINSVCKGYPIKSEDTAVAMHGDTVLARKIEKKWHANHDKVRSTRSFNSLNEKPNVQVIRILKRKHTNITGTLEQGHHTTYVVPDDPLIIQDILVPDLKNSKVANALSLVNFSLYGSSMFILIETYLYECIIIKGIF